MLDRKYITITFLLVIIVGFTGWWLLSHQQNKLVNSDRPENPDSIAEDVHIISMNTEGKPSSEFHASKMIHYPYQNISFATQPALTIFVKNGQPWYITAVYGKAFDGYASIDLWEDVRFKQPASTNNTDSLILTEAFTFLPQQNIGKTESPITILQPGVKITATGLTANTEKGTVELSHNVRGSYAATN